MSWNKQPKRVSSIPMPNYFHCGVSPVNRSTVVKNSILFGTCLSATPLIVALMAGMLLLWHSASHGIEFPYVVDVDGVACANVAADNKCGLAAADSTLVMKTSTQGCGYFNDSGLNPSDGPLNNRWFAKCDPAFESGYAKVCIQGQDNNLGCGLIDSSGELVIPMVYDQLRLAKNVPVVAVNYQNKWGYFSLTEKRLLFAPQFSYVSDFGDGLAYVIDADNQLIEPAWIIDDRGLRVAPVDKSIKVAGHFANGLIPAKIDFRWGYLDSNGTWAIAPQFFAAESFVGGLASVKYVSDPELWAIIDTRGTGLVFFEGPSHRLTLALDSNVESNAGPKAKLTVGCTSEEMSNSEVSVSNEPRTRSSGQSNDNAGSCYNICFSPTTKILEPGCRAQ